MSDELYPLEPWTGKPPKRWNQTGHAITLWHGTADRFVDGIRKGIDLNFSRTRLDFGRGFYTTTFRDQADLWAERAALRKVGSRPVVLEYRIAWERLAPLDSLIFVRPEPDNEFFWSLVTHCRNSPKDAPVLDPVFSHQYRVAEGRFWYDMVCGPVAAKSGRTRQVWPKFDQFSFHTGRATAILDGLMRSGKDTEFQVHTV